VIKPHVLKSGKCGMIINEILRQGYEISAMRMFNLDKPSSDEFLEVY